MNQSINQSTAVGMDIKAVSTTDMRLIVFIPFGDVQELVWVCSHELREYVLRFARKSELHLQGLTRINNEVIFYYAVYRNQ